MPNELVIRDQITEALHDSLRRGSHGLSVLPALLKRALGERAWGERIVRVTGERFPGFPSFEAYVRGAPPEGLGGDVDFVRRVVGDDPVLRDLLDRALQNPDGNPHLTDNNRNSSRPVGTTAEQALRRLRKDRPDLHQRVLAGELSPHRAAVEAGFRPRTATVRLDAVERAVALLLKHFTREELLAALESRP